MLATHNLSASTINVSGLIWLSVCGAAFSGVARLLLLREGTYTLIAAHAAETFTAIGAQIKDESPAERTLFAGYANGLIGYLPTAAEHRKGGYEVDVAPYVFRMPGLLDPNAAQQAAEHSLKLLGRVWDDEE